VIGSRAGDCQQDADACRRYGKKSGSEGDPGMTHAQPVWPALPSRSRRSLPGLQRFDQTSCDLYRGPDCVDVADVASQGFLCAHPDRLRIGKTSGRAPFNCS